MSWLDRFLDPLPGRFAARIRRNRALAKARKIAADDEAFCRSVAAAGGHAGVVAAVAAQIDAEEGAGSRAERYVRVLAGTNGGVTFVHSSPDQHGVVELKEPGAWLGWGRDGFECSRQPTLAIASAGLELIAVEGRSCRVRAWAEGHVYGNLVIPLGTLINFWPSPSRGSAGRVEVVAPEGCAP